jgi:DNA-binding NarL/FixJ family response regulator
MKVLIVDDHPIVHAGLRRLIAIETDAEIREAATAKDALARFREDRPDLVIMALNLPGSGGLEMIRRLRIEDDSAASSSSACMTTRFTSPAPSRQGRSLRDEERVCGPDLARHLPCRRRAQLHRTGD